MYGIKLFGRMLEKRTEIGVILYRVWVLCDVIWWWEREEERKIRSDRQESECVSDRETKRQRVNEEQRQIMRDRKRGKEKKWIHDFTYRWTSVWNVRFGFFLVCVTFGFFIVWRGKFVRIQFCVWDLYDWFWLMTIGNYDYQVVIIDFLVFISIFTYFEEWRARYYKCVGYVNVLWNQIEGCIKKKKKKKEITISWLIYRILYIINCVIVCHRTKKKLCVFFSFDIQINIDEWKNKNKKSNEFWI